MGSSVGVSKCRSRSDLLEGLMEAARYDRRVLIERGVNGREIEISVLGNEDPQASVPGEILPQDDFYTYRAKYIDDTTGFLFPQTSTPTPSLTCKTWRGVHTGLATALEWPG
jgi:D-alanine-D-alanine ligase